MTKNDILNSVEHYSYSQRWLFMVALGKEISLEKNNNFISHNFLKRSEGFHNSKKEEAALASLSKDPSETRQLLKELINSPIHYERFLALMSAYGSKDENIIFKALLDPSEQIMSRVSNLAIQILSDDRLVEAALQLSRKRRIFLMKRLRQVHRTAVNDRIYGYLSESEANKTIQFLSEEAIRQWFHDNDIHSLSISQWKRLTLRMPEFVMKMLLQQLEAPGEPSWVMQHAISCSLGIMIRYTPVFGKQLLERAILKMRPSQLPIIDCLSKFPSFVTNLIENHQLAYSFRDNGLCSFLKRIDLDLFQRLIRAEAIYDLQYLYHRLSVEQRLTVYDILSNSLREKSGALPISFVTVLPEPVRHREAYHAISLIYFNDKPIQRFLYIACLPFQEALTHSEPFLQQPDGNLRASALKAVIGSTRYQSSRMTDVLNICVQKRNEQDPVRLAMINALSALPPSRWQDEQLPLIRQIIEATLDARDCSQSTLRATMQWLLKMTVFQTAFVADMLPVIVQRQGSLSYFPMGNRISDCDMKVLAKNLMPLLNDWVRRNRPQYALHLIQ